MTARWTHKDGSDDHAVDPHYNGRPPVMWSCYVTVGKGERCDKPVLLDGAAVPVTGGVSVARSLDEPPMSSQP